MWSIEVLNNGAVVDVSDVLREALMMISPFEEGV